MTMFTRVTVDRCHVSHNKHKASPVINEKGDFFLSARDASVALKLGNTSVAGAIVRGGKAGGTLWRHATFDECVKHGVEVPKGLKMPKALRDLKKRKVKEVAADSIREVPFESVAPKKRGRPPKARGEATAATFNAVAWPDGAVTIRLNHGNTWTMTRRSKDQIPPEMLRECVWVGPQPTGRA